MMRALLLAILIASGACGPTLVAQSVPPAGRVARLDPVTGFWGLQSYRLELSAGVALALQCYRGRPCEKMEVRSDSPNVEVRLASIGALEQVGYAGAPDQVPAAGFVLIGKAPGPAKITVRTQGKVREIAVTVVPPPSPAPPARVAR